MGWTVVILGMLNGFSALVLALICFVGVPGIRMNVPQRLRWIDFLMTLPVILLFIATSAVLLIIGIPLVGGK